MIMLTNNNFFNKKTIQDNTFFTFKNIFYYEVFRLRKDLETRCHFLCPTSVPCAFRPREAYVLYAFTSVYMFFFLIKLLQAFFHEKSAFLRDKPRSLRKHLRFHMFYVNFGEDINVSMKIRISIYIHIKICFFLFIIIICST